MLTSKISTGNILKYNKFREILSNHHLKEGEIRTIFKTADRNKDNEISGEEWHYFYKLFIQPFEEDCDKDGNYKVTDKEIVKCLKSDTLNGTALNKEDSQKVLDILDRENEKAINFADYLFLRRANLAWKECAKDDDLGVGEIACAIQIACPAGKAIDYSKAKEIFNTAIIIQLF